MVNNFVHVSVEFLKITYIYPSENDVSGRKFLWNMLI